MQPLSPDLKARVEELEWRGHCIRLDDDTLTLPGRPPLVESPRFRTIMKLLDEYVGDVKGKRILDMGAFEGGFALALAQRGAEVLGIEARQTNMNKLDVLTEAFALPNLRFEQGDVKDVRGKSHGRWDVMLALGILDHLDQPSRWLAHMAWATDVIIVEANVAPEDHELAEHRARDKLTSIRELKRGDRVYKGRWYQEFAPDQDPERYVMAAWSNPDSFWFTRESLPRAIVEAGFTPVIEFSSSFTVTTNARSGAPRALLVGRRHSPT